MPTTGTMKYLTIGDSTYEVYNTDTEVIQTYAAANGYTNWRPLVVGYSSNSSETTAPTTTTGTTYTFNTIKVKPSDGIIRFGAAALYNGDYTTTISADTLTAARTLTAPDKSGTIALTSDIPSLTGYATTTYVDGAIAALPEPMLFKGSVGTGGTITSLPTAAAANEGFTYKVITALSTPVTAKVGDTVISTGSEWVVIPSGDEPSGTVTSVGLSNATNGGLSISGGPITSSGSITVGHSNVLDSAQTTQAVYPIKIDKNGHISEYGSAVSIPTKVSDLQNDSGFITSDSDEKVAVGGITSGSTYYPIVGSGMAAATRQIDSTGFSYDATTSTTGYARITLGNSTAQPISGSKYGSLRLYGTTANSTTIVSGAPTAIRTITLPDKTGTVALISDIPTVPTITLNGSSTTSASFYAPTSAGTYGYVLKSNGSGAPTWTSATLTDEKVKTTPTTLDVLNGYLTFSSSATETTNTLNKHSSIQIAIDADTVINGQTQLTLGNTIVEGDSGAKIGVLELYGPNQYMVRLTPDTLTDTRLIKLPNKAGTIALTSDIPTVPTIYLNDAPATLYSFYAPTSAGTSGYYLKSNGSGAPTWATIPAGVTVTLNGSTTTTPLFYAPTTAGTLGQVLTSNGSGAPTWAAAQSGSSTQIIRWTES